MSPEPETIKICWTVTGPSTTITVVKFWLVSGSETLVKMHFNIYSYMYWQTTKLDPLWGSKEICKYIFRYVCQNVCGTVLVCSVVSTNQLVIMINDLLLSSCEKLTDVSDKTAHQLPTFCNKEGALKQKKVPPTAAAAGDKGDMWARRLKLVLNPFHPDCKTIFHRICTNL